MKLTLSVIKADIGSIGGHIAPSQRLLETVGRIVRERSQGVLLDHYISYTGDDIAISASGFGGGLTAGMDVTSIFETSGDDQFSGFGAEFHFDTGNQTLYFSADGTQASAVAIVTVQAGVVLNPHDLLIV